MGTKKCYTCKEEKEYEEFSINRCRRDGRQSTCRACQSRVRKEKYANDPLYRENAKKNSNKYRKRWTHYKLSEQEYQVLFGKYDGKCYSCQTRPAKVIDHDHSCCSSKSNCGKCIRGALCYQCNTSLGLMDDNIDRINSLLEYLRCYGRVDR